MIEITAWAPTRDLAIAFLQEAKIATVDENNNIVPIAEVQIHPFRPNEEITVVKTPAVINPATMAVITPAVIVPGFHWNMRFYGDSELALSLPLDVVSDIPAVDTDLKDTSVPSVLPVNKKALFEKTAILSVVETNTSKSLTWVDSVLDVIPPGYETSTKVRLFDPALIKTRRNVWA